MPTVIIFFIIFSILILVHELGHFLTAKKAGVRVEEFGFGYPPRLLGKKLGETLYSLNLIPFGGFVRLYGHEQVAETDLNRAFSHKSKLKRSIIIALVYSKLGIPGPVDYVRVLDVVQASPAHPAGLRPGDKLITINGQAFNNSQEFIALIEANRGQEVIIERQDQEAVRLTPRAVELTPEGEGALGIGISDIDFRFYPWWQMPFRGIVAGLEEAFLWGKEILAGLSLMIRQLITGTLPEVAGPVGIYQMTGEIKQSGFLALAQFMGVLSINLAIINLLPIPGVDGSWLIFVWLEDLLGKRKRQIETIIGQVGFALLILLMLLITIGDVRRLLSQ